MLLQTIAYEQYIRSDNGRVIGIANSKDVIETLDSEALSKLGKPVRLQVKLRRVDGYMSAEPLREWMPVGHVLAGLHGPADPGLWAWDEKAFETVQESKVQCVKLLTGADLDYTVVNRLRQINPEMFILARIMGSIYQGETKTGKQYVQAEEHSIAKLYNAGIRYFEIGNEPNLYPALAPEGMGVMWQNGQEYAKWWLEARDYLAVRFPLAKWGFPAMSPGEAKENERFDGDLFLAGARKAIRKADWVAYHVYWGFGKGELQALIEIAEFARRISKPVLVTEFSNPNPIYMKYAKGYQYGNFYRQAKFLVPAYVMALISYCLSSSSGFEPETWKGSEIPIIVGQYLTSVA